MKFAFLIQINSNDDRVIVEVSGISFADAWSNAVNFCNSFNGKIAGHNGAIVVDGWPI